MTKYTVVAKVGKTHGLTGALVLHLFTENPSKVLKQDNLFIRLPKKPWEKLSQAQISSRGNGHYIQFSHLNTKELAQTFVNAELGIPIQDLPKLTEEFSYYWAELENLDVYNLANEHLGTVDHLINTGQHDVLVLSGQPEVLIPFVRHYIQSVDLIQKRIVADWELDW